ncbi:sensor histidine kinase [Salininema proteolyticum]|uniref:histidine kinase n=1 Tax=Salininema proteolyticum TaxID=1607685 RepID=A0ABV8U231_9ACTN
MSGHQTSKKSLFRRMWEFDSRRPLVWDTAVVGVWWLIIVLAEIFVWAQHFGTFSVPTMLVILALGIPLLWRRRRPFRTQLIIVVPLLLSVFSSSVNAQLAAGIALLLVLFNVSLRCPWWKIAISFGIATIVSILQAVVVNAEWSWWELLGSLVASVFGNGFIVVLGLLIATKREHVVAVEQQAVQQAAMDERHRIAREMHDIIGHNLAVVNALADGGTFAARAGSHGQAQEALEAISDTSRQALSELRRVLGVLRDDDVEEEAELNPQPGLSDIDELIDRVRATGRSVHHTVSGTPWDLDKGRELVLYRTVQEALTNVLKHTAPGISASVSLTYREEDLYLEVANGGLLATSADAGRGLTGLAERAKAFGGTMEAGPSPNGGWAVSLRLPHPKE